MGETGAGLLPVGTGVSCESCHSPRGGFKPFSKVCGSASLAFLHLPRARVMGWFGQASNQRESSKGGNGGCGQAPPLDPKNLWQVSYSRSAHAAGLKFTQDAVKNLQ